MTTDKRRFGVIEVWRRNAETYHLMIDGQMWSEVEWSHDRQAWCVQDAAGHCLTHVEHIVGQDRDPQTAIRLAKRVIVDGRMPTPEEALQQLRERQERYRLGEPFVISEPGFESVGLPGDAERRRRLAGVVSTPRRGVLLGSRFKFDLNVILRSKVLSR